MRTNLIQSYLNDSNASQRYNSDNAKKNFDVNRELNNRTFIKPLQSNGHLVSNSLFDAPSELLKDLKYNAKALKHSVQGTAKDKELGNLNDMGMKLGGLAIATYLFAMKQTPVVKLMEFVGFGTFFAAMNLWPKLALQLPAYLIHGFNIRQEYRDNFGTKKPVFLDHQFIPWDLYSDEKINKIGDRLGVPKNMKNRRDFIQEKMRKIALQNNTMWMLTSGFATPIMSALMCDIMQKPIADYIGRLKNKKADKLMQNFKNEVEKYDFTPKNTTLYNLLEANRGKQLTPELISEISKAVSSGLDTLTGEAINRDMQRIYQPHGFDISKNNFEELHKTMRAELSKAVKDEELLNLVPSADEIIEKLGNEEKDILKSGNTKSNVTDFSEYIKAFVNAKEEKLAKFTEQNQGKNTGKISFLLDKILYSKDKKGELNLTNAFKSVVSGILSDDKIKEFGEINGIVNNLICRQDVLDKYAYMKAAQAPETSLANSWNDFLSDDMLKTLGITDKEIKQTRMDSKLVHDLIREKFETIVANPDKYDEVINKLNEKLCKLEKETNFADFNRNNTSRDSYKNHVDSTFNNASDALKSKGFRFTPERLTGYEPQDVHTLKDLQLSFVQDRVRGVRSSFYRILNTLDMFKRVSSGEIEKFFGDKMPLQVKEEMIEMCKELLLGGHSSDYEVKFYHPRNPEINSDCGKLEIKDGKIVYKYVGKTPAAELADMPYDIDFYSKAMKLMYRSDLDDATSSKIKDSSFIGDFKKYRSDMFTFHGGNRYFAKPYHYADGKEVKSTTEFRFQLLGSSIDDMFTKLFSSKYNSKKWMNMFGGFGLALLGITVLSQFFMGRMPSDNNPNGGKQA